MDIIFEKKCLICDKKILNKYFPSWICKKCLKEIKFIKNIKCSRCGSPFKEKCLCVNLSNEIIQNRSLFLYDKSGKELIHKWKYSGYYFISDLFLKKISKLNFSSYDGVIAVPVSFIKIIKRGFNQAHVIARFISKKFKIKDFSHLISRKHSRPQMELDDYNLRKENVKGIFKLKKIPECKNILIVDDIITSCSTVNEIAHLLKSEGFYGNIFTFTLSMAI